MSFDSAVAPKVFISYCWTTPGHEEWVLQLATDMRQEGIDAILDKWDLGIGDDAYAFMERMVNDSTITKVVIVCDRMYAKKANDRLGGVGAETQVLTSDLYGKKEQTKYALLATELDENGVPYRPTYYGGRIHIDFTDTSKYVDKLEELVRWVFDKPLHKKPELGAPPSYVQNNVHEVDLGLRLHYQQAINAVRKHQPNAEGIVNDYLQLVSTNLERLRTVGDDSEPIDEKILRSIERFIPYRNELISLFIAIVQHHDTEGMRRAIHRFFERIITYLERPDSVQNGMVGDCDNFRFIVHELFLYLIASAIQYEAFDFATYFIATGYYVANPNISNEATAEYNIFFRWLDSLEHRNERLKLNHLSIHADLLRDRCIGNGLSHQDIMQADFILFVCNHVRSDGKDRSWVPISLVHAGQQRRPFEAFARSTSRQYFLRFQQLWNAGTDGLLNIIEELEASRGIVLRFEYGGVLRVYARALSNFEQLAAKP